MYENLQNVRIRVMACLAHLEAIKFTHIVLIQLTKSLFK
jgi:hypothetical protein